MHEYFSGFEWSVFDGCQYSVNLTLKLILQGLPFNEQTPSKWINPHCLIVRLENHTGPNGYWFYLVAGGISNSLKQQFQLQTLIIQLAKARTLDLLFTINSDNIWVKNRFRLRVERFIWNVLMMCCKILIAKHFQTIRLSVHTSNLMLILRKSVEKFQENMKEA